MFYLQFESELGRMLDAMTDCKKCGNCGNCGTRNCGCDVS